jgi:hypothetical protein
MVRWFNGEETAPFDSALLEDLTAWNDREAAAVLGEGGLTLAQAWQRLLPLLEATPGRPLKAGKVAMGLGVSRDNWDAWVSRGWRRLQQGLGDDVFARVFSFWRGRQRGERP